MIDRQSGNIITFNGEIYNHRELRNRLPGVRWQGESDTETLLAAYRKWGAEMLSQLKGMFAFVIYDSATGELFAARDRLGIKPLYYRRSAEGIQFASEIRLLSIGGEETVSAGACSTYLRFGAFSEEQLPFASVRSVPAGHYLQVRAVTSRERPFQKKLEVAQTCYWPPPRSSRAAKPGRWPWCGRCWSAPSASICWPMYPWRPC